MYKPTHPLDTRHPSHIAIGSSSLPFSFLIFVLSHSLPRLHLRSTACIFDHCNRKPHTSRPSSSFSLLALPPVSTPQLLFSLSPTFLSLLPPSLPLFLSFSFSIQIIFPSSFCFFSSLFRKVIYWLLLPLFSFHFVDINTVLTCLIFGSFIVSLRNHNHTYHTSS